VSTSKSKMGPRCVWRQSDCCWWYSGRQHLQWSSDWVSSASSGHVWWRRRRQREPSPASVLKQKMDNVRTNRARWKLYTQVTCN